MPEQEHSPAARAVVPFKTIAHFYDPDDTSPEERRELSERAEKEIFHEILDRPRRWKNLLPNELEVSFPAAELSPGRPAAITAAIRSHFRHRSDEVRRDMRLTVAVCIPSFLGIAACSLFKSDPLAEVIKAVLIIFCWVTIWQPFQLLVFDRWTQSETSKIYRKIAEMAISVKGA